MPSTLIPGGWCSDTVLFCSHSRSRTWRDPDDTRSRLPLSSALAPPWQPKWPLLHAYPPNCKLSYRRQHLNTTVDDI